MQLMHPFVQKWTTTTLPFWSASLSGFEFIQSVTPVNSGADSRVVLTVPEGAPAFGTGRPSQPRTARVPAVKPRIRTAPSRSLVFMVFLPVRMLLMVAGFFPYHYFIHRSSYHRSFCHRSTCSNSAINPEHWVMVIPG